MSNSYYHINLEQNGKIFPSWVMKNFKKYILPEILIIPGKDPCDEVKLKELTLYQKFIGKYLNYQSPFRDILIYHGVGSGKTNTAINVYNILYNYTIKWNVFLLIPASLHDDPWMKDLKDWLVKENFDNRLTNIIFIHYDSPYADRDFLEKLKNTVNTGKTNIFIIDEAHNFINNVYSNMKSKVGKKAQFIYEQIQKEKRENSATRIILLSATPVINNPFEFSLIFNLLRPDILPLSESLFEQYFISPINYTSINPTTINLFQRRIIGLVSYYIGATPDKFAQKQIHFVNVEMSSNQETVYNYFELIEEKKELMKKKFFKRHKDTKISTYNIYTRQACNFTFPKIDENIQGIKRPRLKAFKISSEDLVEMNESNNINSNTKTKMTDYLEKSKEFINKFILYLKNIHRSDISNKHVLNDDIKNFQIKYNSSFTKLINSSDKKSNLFSELYNSSSKFIKMIFNIFKTSGTVMIYSNFVLMEGLEILKIYLNFFGFINIDADTTFDKNNINNTTKLSTDFYRFCEFHGGIDKNIRTINKNIFNSKENVNGKYCKIILISPAGAEGINLNNVRQVHILEPYWNEARIEQIIGRAIRYCQHKDLPIEERKVDIFRYKSVKKSGKKTTDENIEYIALKKNELLTSFINAIKEVAIDCNLFKAHNMMMHKYKCFQFNEDALFNINIGPAYQFKLDEDKKYDNGLNALGSDIKRIKVKKIKAVKKINNTFSDPLEYWLNEDSGIIYDYELDFPIGKILKNTNNEFIYYNNYYVIDSEILIPVINYT